MMNACDARSCLRESSCYPVLMPVAYHSLEESRPCETAYRRADMLDQPPARRRLENSERERASCFAPLTFDKAIP